MSFSLEEYLLDKGLSPTKSDVDYIDYIVDNRGYTYFSGMISTIDIDRIYNKFREKEIESAIVAVNQLPGMITIDYASRRKVDIKLVEDIIKREEVLDPKIGVSRKSTTSSDLGAEANNQSNYKSEKNVSEKLNNSSKSELEGKSTTRLSGSTNNEKINSEVKRIKTTRPSEVNNKSVKRKKSGVSITISTLVFAGVFLLILLPAIIDDITYTQETYHEENDYKEMEVISNYQFEKTDLLANDAVFNNKIDAVRNIKLGQGQEYTFTQKTDPFPQNPTYEDDKKLIVGTDIEPGIYTVSVSGDADIYISNNTEIRIADDGVLNYNIPLGEGSKLEIEANSSVEEYEVKLVPQTEFVQYEEGLTGQFIYGLSYFDSNLDVDFSRNTVVYSYPFNNEYNQAVRFKEDSDNYIAGIPGSYVYIKSNEY